jgi:hypothetical protein
MSHESGKEDQENSVSWKNGEVETNVSKQDNTQ